MKVCEWKREEWIRERGSVTEEGYYLRLPKHFSVRSGKGQGRNHGQQGNMVVTS